MADVPGDLELAVGETWTVQLEGASGYRWHAAVQGDDGVVQAATDYADGDVKEGGWRGDVVAVTGLRPGSAVVRIVRRRSWETEGGDGQIMQVTVRPA